MIMNNKFQTPLVPISWGELIDKITILEIKEVKITSNNALDNIRKELGFLSDIVSNSKGVYDAISLLKNELKEVNLNLWQVEDEIRDKEYSQEFDEEFIRLARSVYRLNDDRANLKKKINETLFSELKEEKSYKNFRD
jgi:predicted  nucleic acid-binding Zn-ribbon protein